MLNSKAIYASAMTGLGDLGTDTSGLGTLFDDFFPPPVENRGMVPG